MSDFSISDHGTVISIRPPNELARQWLDENVVSEPWQWARSASRPASPAISFARSKRPGSRYAPSRCRTLRRCARRGAAGLEQSRSRRRPRMGIALLVWLVLLYFWSGKPGWFACVLVLLVVGILIAGC